MQLALPLSVGAQIARHGATPSGEAAADDLCPVAQPRATSEDTHPASHRANDGSNPSVPSGACALCAALCVMHAFTGAPVLTLPIPVRAESSRPVALHDAAFAALPFAVYRSRAPPLVS